MQGAWCTILGGGCMGDAGKTPKRKYALFGKGHGILVARIILASKSLDRPSQSLHQTSSMQTTGEGGWGGKQRRKKKCSSAFALRVPHTHTRNIHTKGDVRYFAKPQFFGDSIRGGRHYSNNGALADSTHHPLDSDAADYCVHQN